MPDRTRLASPIRLISSLPLLVLVLITLVGTAGPAAGSYPPDRFRRDLALVHSQPTPQLDSVTASDPVLEMNALAVENEEQDRADVLDEPRFSFVIPCSLRKALDRRLIAPRSILSLYPLRC